ncbi:MAG: PhoH family protein [Deltaproteobacteria bacterium]|nr:PhoH family protein [Deltaproteobacteria bacterium]
MKKNFVLDTNVLLYDPNALMAFEDNNIVIPIYCVEEVDQFKKDLSELGRNARQVSRMLDRLRHGGSLSEGVPIEGTNGGTLRVAFTARILPPEFANNHKTDNRILATALDVREREPGTPLIFISKDINLRIRGAALGLEVQDYDTERADISELYSGWFELTLAPEALQEFYTSGEAALPPPPAGEPYPPNAFAMVGDGSGLGASPARLRTDTGRVVALKTRTHPVWGIKPRNSEQRFAFELLLDDKVRLVTLAGKAGTGKTLLALAAGLQKVAEEEAYQKLLVSRPIFPLGRDIGFLPGDVEDKLRPWMQPVHDNLELLLGLGSGDKKTGRTADDVFGMDMVHIEPLTYIRGRSIPRQFILVDEAQNLTPHEVKTIITRVGDDTKIVLTGDPYQIDNPYVDAVNNGLVHVVNRFRMEPLAGHVTMTKGERSSLAERAANLL